MRSAGTEPTTLPGPGLGLQVVSQVILTKPLKSGCHCSHFPDENVEAWGVTYPM